MKRVAFILKMFSLLVIITCEGCSHNELIEFKYNPINIVQQSKTINMIGYWRGEGDREKFLINTIRDYGL